MPFRCFFFGLMHLFTQLHYRCDPLLETYPMSTGFFLVVIVLMIGFLYGLVMSYLLARTTIVLSQEIDVLQLVCAESNPVGASGYIRKLKKERLTVAIPLCKKTFREFLISVAGTIGILVGMILYLCAA